MEAQLQPLLDAPAQEVHLRHLGHPCLAQGAIKFGATYQVGLVTPHWIAQGLR